MLAETAQHAGHCDLVRELVDGHTGGGVDAAFTVRIQAAADTFR